MGNYRGPSHKGCNLSLRPICKIPVFLQNLRSYDSNFITMALKDFEGVEIRVIGQGIEKFLLLPLGKYLVFKCCLHFLGSSIATLA